MLIDYRLVSGFVLSGLLYAGLACAAVPTAQKPAARVWFGDFTNTLQDGRISHDKTALVLQQDGGKLTGGVGSTIDRLAPILDGTVNGDEMSFRIEGGGGIIFVLHQKAGHIIGTAKSSRVNAVLDLTPAPGLTPHDQLVAEIAAADEQNFAAYDTCDTAAYTASLSPELEFYQDNQPVKTRDAVLIALGQRCAEGIKLRRELDASSLIVNAAPPEDAIEAGLHRIYSIQPDGSEHLDATARFTMVWSKKSGNWQLLRVISYDHR
ncbi:nuclear transport factor 2 family protein [Asticcacaulis sp. 201]|uniref:nuclear transport factor 2 family protein n=1 Tax=Asticcacaulis sp. 201 TaxID=3028787 RepID=UPI002915F31D|nr:nuclear transport factor 2 family protein [Asticcacaulis sp. 201]MDV6331074.1 nuclear transport factor 2 family protein [Asticcacaulis sp. 201]